MCLAVLPAWSRFSQDGIMRFVLSHRETLEEIAADFLNQNRTAERYKGVEV